MRKIGSCQEYFETLNERFIPEKAKGVDATYTYELDGAGTWTVHIKDQGISVTEGPVEKPSVTYKMKADNYVKLANGEMNGARAVMTRKLKVSGSIALAQKMNKFLPPAGK